jgi:formate hydrogenlyase subunit 6/NADH:ubiquinone oxidoreductase subunit I
MLSMLGTIFGNLFAKPATRPYPASPRNDLSGYRGELAFDMDACTFCGACARACPARCLTVDIKTCVLQSDPFACVYCGVCVEECATGAATFSSHHRAPADLTSQLVQRGEKKTKEQIAELRKRKLPTA